MTTQNKIATDGFAIINDVFTADEIDHIIAVISNADSSKPAFRKTNDLFAIRQFFKEIPDVVDLIFTPIFCNLLTESFGYDFFVVKSIYFDKPESSNWFVSYHQDLTISVDKKISAEGFGPWSSKQSQYAVQPTLNILQDNFTIRIHLDKTNEQNGALKVIAGSHAKGIRRPETIDRKVESEVSCNVEEGGVMIMKPLLLHSSGRTTNGKKRRVIHLEFSRSNLPKNLYWSEQLIINK